MTSPSLTTLLAQLAQGTHLCVRVPGSAGESFTSCVIMDGQVTHLRPLASLRSAFHQALLKTSMLWEQTAMPRPAGVLSCVVTESFTEAFAETPGELNATRDSSWDYAELDWDRPGLPLADRLRGGIHLIMSVPRRFPVQFGMTVVAEGQAVALPGLSEAVREVMDQGILEATLWRVAHYSVVDGCDEDSALRWAYHLVTGEVVCCLPGAAAD